MFRDAIQVQDHVIQSPAAVNSATVTSITSLDEYISRHKLNHNHYTIIVLRMRSHIASSLRRRSDIALTLSNELADIYHFHLHPNDLPNTLLRSDRFQTM